MHALLLAGVLLAAPVPKEIGRPPDLAHGVYSILWNNSAYTATLSGNGEFSEFCGNGMPWVGTWNWDAQARVLTVSETVCGDYYFRWHVVLDDKLSGTTDGGVKVAVTPFRPPAVMEGK